MPERFEVQALETAVGQQPHCFLATRSACPDAGQQWPAASDRHGDVKRFGSRPLQVVEHSKRLPPRRGQDLGGDGQWIAPGGLVAQCSGERQIGHPRQRRQCAALHRDPVRRCAKDRGLANARLARHDTGRLSVTARRTASTSRPRPISTASLSAEGGVHHSRKEGVRSRPTQDLPALALTRGGVSFRDPISCRSAGPRTAPHGAIHR